MTSERRLYMASEVFEMGAKILKVRPMTKKEIAEEGWMSGGTVLVISDGTKLYASRDEEGNGPGALFGVKKNGERFIIL